MSTITILIVEDEAIVAADLAGKLARLGYEVAGTAAQGEQAVALACRLRPQLVLMDIWLEGPMDGIEAAEAIRCQPTVTQRRWPVRSLRGHSDTFSSRLTSGIWPRRSRWHFTDIRPTGNSASSGSGCGSR